VAEAEVAATVDVLVVAAEEEIGDDVEKAVMIVSKRMKLAVSLMKSCLVGNAKTGQEFNKQFPDKSEVLSEGS
jgi:hypothetical protein